MQIRKILLAGVVLGIFAFGCGTEDSNEQSSGKDDSRPVCDAIAIPCCDKQSGEYVQEAECTHSGRQCPTGTGKCSRYGAEADAETSEPPACDAVAIPCCDTQTGEYEQEAECTHDGLKCPEGTRREDCSRGRDAATDGKGETAG